MTLSCPICGRSQPGAAGASFCMFCGGRLPADARDVTGSYAPTETVDPTDENPALPPDRVGGYRFVRQLGAGGMGTVYEAEADDDGRRVAVKLLSPKLAGNRTSVERFKQEGRLASQISHPRCVFVYEADTDLGRPFIVMELMPGTTLKDLVDRRGPLSVGEAVARLLDVIDGLIEAHRLGVIHRDMKPSNCFVTADDRVKVGDFGLSKSLDADEARKQLTSSGAFMGTVLFAPPEQIRGEEVGYDSDVYSVAATLFYVLTGRAPYQHDSLTAALAKAISEPPPSVRAKRPDVPRALDRVVRRGLERDRNRRFGTLEEMRDALAEFLPGQAIPARRRVLITAYLLDLVALLALVLLPVELLESAIGLRAGLFASPFDPLLWAGGVAYFALFEGRTGTTPGKALLRVRVTRGDEVGPPGVRPAAVRVVAFDLMGVALLSLPFVLADIPHAGPPLAVLVAVAGGGALSYQLWPRAGGRGLHDLASGLRAVQRRRPMPRPRFVLPGGPVAASADDSLPPVVGGYEVTGKACDLAGGGMVWAAEDRTLGRRIFLWLVPAADVPADPPTPPDRPTRLRTVGTAEVIWDGRVFGAAAYVAPAGAVLPDLIDPHRPRSWADARTILEQVVEELEAGTADGTLPPRLGVDQLWVEPSGRVHLLDFCLPTTAATPPATDPLGLVRQTATLLLEGHAREAGGPVRAPIPPHAMALTADLFAACVTLTDVTAALAASHAHPPRASAAMRAAQLWLTGLIGVGGLLLLFGSALAANLLVAMAASSRAEVAEKAATGLRDPAVRRVWGAVVVADAERHPDAADRLDRFARAQRAANDSFAVHSLSRVERGLIGWYTGSLRDGIVPARLTPKAVRDSAERADTFGHTGRASVFDERPAVTTSSGALVLWAVCVGGYALFAVAFRGGLAYVLAGLTLVRRDGRPAERWRCGVRELLAWLPLVAVLAVAVGVQSVWPTSFAVRVVAAVGCLAVLATGVVLALRDPDHGPTDKLIGTYVVPV